MPLDENLMLRWPAWTQNATSQQMEWFGNFFMDGSKVPLKKNKSNDEDDYGIEPDWPSS